MHGYVADYCVVCRDVVVHAVISLRDIGQTALSCEQCGLRMRADVRNFAELCPARDAPIQDLIGRTHPLLACHCIDRAEFDHYLVCKGTTPEVRASAIKEPIGLADYLMRRKLDSIHASWYWAIALATGVVMFSVGISPVLSDRWVWPSTLAVLVCIGTLLAGAWTWSRWAERKLRRQSSYDLIARSLRPLQPTVEELRSARGVLRATGEVPPWFREEDVIARMVQLRDTSFSNMSFEEICAQASEQFRAREALARSLAAHGEAVPEHKAHPADGEEDQGG